MIFLDGRWKCPHAGCRTTYLNPVFDSLSDGDTEAPRDGDQGSEAEDNENPEDEEDGAEDGEDEEDGDHSSESEYDVENSDDVEPTAESAVAWLGSLSKDQKILREAARSEGLFHLGLKCPGPEMVVGGLVLGTKVCPRSAIISFEAGANFTQEGTLNASRWSKDSKKEWLQQEGFHDILPGDENACLLYHEFCANLQRVIGKTCHRGRAFPLKLPVVFPLLFGEEDPLSGKNHHALIDAKQLCRMAKVFIDLCKPPGQRLGVDKLRSGKRERKTEEFLSSMRLNKRLKRS
ncbi:Threonyl/alanyl tRNA synthetase SAD [Penicillium hordei]|uniref:Threonyl/alanyl tRNA synthetase SAD n=1 Tax=Penicillium hordei TaxID=40994 RepID=A0AAD6E098_9EURO|nr:Threonyl/alanyl tRNA synthetase SAD [Penicillium hordei]KAJ5597568.1 Threonyl/alanyl tRNA synthetase SAD [Penicillium hordei]